MKRYGAAVLGAVLAVAATTAFVGCGSDSPSSQFVTDASSDLDAAVDSGHGFSAVSVEPPDAILTVVLGGSATQTYKAFAVVGGAKTDITSSCGFTLTDNTFGGFSGASFAAAPRGGVTQVIANCDGTVGSAKLTLNLKGAVLVGGAPANSEALFLAAVPSTDPARTPTIEYPLDGSVAPLNIPAIDAQWSAAQNDLFRATFVSAHVALDLYTAVADAQFDSTVWAVVAQSASGDTLAITVEGLQKAQPAQKFKSSTSTMKLSMDRIDDTALYYWASSNGNLMTQTFGATGAPSQVKGDCTSCHSVSRTGSRVGYSRCVGGDCNELFAGFMKFDTQTKTWKDTLDANQKAVRGSYTTFSPLGYPYATDAQSAALLAKSDCTLALYDPDTGQPVPSNVNTVATHDGSGPARCATMPDWSPDGRTIAFASTPNTGDWIDVASSALATMSYTFANATHAFGEPRFILRQPITLGGNAYNSFFFPSFSPDGKFLVFNAARDRWRNFTDAKAPGQRLMMTDPEGTWTLDLAKLNGGGDSDITWPHWAPAKSNEYYWVVFSSERDYGHKLTAANSAAGCVGNGVKQCKQIWIAAIEKSKLAQSPPADPSAAPVWMPGQDLGADNISPYWTVPTTLIPK